MCQFYEHLSCPQEIAFEERVQFFCGFICPNYEAAWPRNKGKFSKKTQAQAGSATFEEAVPYAGAEHLFPLTMLRCLPNIDGPGRLNIGEGKQNLP